MSVAATPTRTGLARPEAGAADVRRRTLLEVAGRVVVYWIVWSSPKSLFYDDLADYARRASSLSWTRLPYRSVPWEFPPLTVPFIVLAKVFGHAPDRLAVCFGAATIALEYGSLRLLRRAWPERATALTWWWSCLVLPVATLAWFRLDFLAVFFATAMLVAVESRRPAARWSVLGVFAKLWPVAGLGMLAARRAWRQVVLGVAAIGAGLATWWAWSPAGVRGFFGYRAGGGLEVESFLGSAVQFFHSTSPRLDAGAWAVGIGGWRWVNLAGLAVLALVGLAIVIRASMVRADAVAVGGALVGLILLVSRLLSAQYVVWLAPFVVVLAAVRGRTRLGLAAAATSVLTFATIWWWEPIRLGTGAGPALMLARNVVLLWLIVELLVEARRPTTRPT